MGESNQMVPGQDDADVEAQRVEFPPVEEEEKTTSPEPLDMLFDIGLTIRVELGRTRRTVKEVLQFAPGSVVELEKLAGEPVDVYVNNRLMARGEVVAVDENFGVRITEIIRQR